MQNNELDQASVRAWLKEMPDAGFFADGVWLACDDEGCWCAFSGKPDEHWGGFFHCDGYYELSCLNMPTLEGDQWKYSCISVIELAEWQMENAK